MLLRIKAYVTPKPEYVVLLVLLCLAVALVITVLFKNSFTKDELSDSVIWELESVSVAGVPTAPSDVFVYSNSPQLLFVGGSYTKGYDGCNWFSGRYFSAQSNYIRLERTENTLMACDVVLPPGFGGSLVPGITPVPQSSNSVNKLDFLDTLSTVVRYERKGNELYLYYPVTEINAMIFRPSKRPKQRVIDWDVIRAECYDFPYIRLLVGDWCLVK